MKSPIPNLPPTVSIVGNGRGFGLCDRMNAQIIEQTNAPVWRAIAAVRIDRNPATMGELYDALNRRRNARACRMPDWQRRAWSFEIDSDLRNWGQVERTHAELVAAVNNHRLCGVAD